MFSPPPAEPPGHYLILFGGQATKLRPRTAHTWATYVRTTATSSGMMLDEFTISWLPESLDVRPCRLRTEPGLNLTMTQTLDLMSTGKHVVSMWGPFAIDAGYFEEARQYKERLDSGAIRYRVVAREGRDDICHCVHAILRTNAELDRAADPILSYGRTVSQHVANSFARAGLVRDPQITHDWLIPALGLDRYHLDREPIGQTPLRHLLPITSR